MKVSSVEAAGEVPKDVIEPSNKRMKRVLSVIDFILRIVAAISTLGSALSMGTARETLPFRTQFVKFRAVFEDLPTFMFFVLSNSIVCAYLVLSLPLSFFHIVKTSAVKSRILMVLLDTIMFGLLTTGAAAAAAIVFLAHRGNPSANWFPICQQYNYFCERISGSVIGSFMAVVLFMILILLSAISISKH